MNTAKFLLILVKPVFLNNILDHQQPDWASESYDDDSRPAWTRDIVANLSEQIMTRINQAATVNSINLIASVLLAASNQSMDEKDLAHQLETYKTLLRSLRLFRENNNHPTTW